MFRNCVISSMITILINVNAKDKFQKYRFINNIKHGGVFLNHERKLVNTERSIFEVIIDYKFPNYKFQFYIPSKHSKILSIYLKR